MYEFNTDSTAVCMCMCDTNACAPCTNVTHTVLQGQTKETVDKVDSEQQLFLRQPISTQAVPPHALNIIVLYAGFLEFW